MSSMIRKLSDGVREGVRQIQRRILAGKRLYWYRKNNKNNKLYLIFQRELERINTPLPPLQSPDIRKNLIICFTPRSGSSWLTEMVEKSGGLGRAGEYLNPEHLPKIMSRYPASSLSDYLAHVLKGTSSYNRVASIELTWFHLRNFALALGYKPLEDSLPKPFDGDSWYVWLLRRNFVAQAVSLYKATESGFFHSIQGQDGQIEGKKIPYSRKKIKNWCEHILQQEFGFERWFELHGIEPLRFFYEDLCDNPAFILKLLYTFVNEPFPEGLDFIESSHKKIGDEHSQMLIDQFVEEEHRFIDYWRKNRGVKPTFKII